MPNARLPRHTRRELVAGGLALGAALAARATAAQPASPAASPSASTTDAALIDADWLAPRHDTGDITLVAFMPLDAAEADRIPGAVQIDWPELEITDTSDASLATWQTEVERLVGDLGVRPDRPVAVYDDGSLFAARFWWLLHWLGHEQNHLLDGGLAAWRDAGLPTMTGPIARTRIAHPPYPGTPQAAALAQKAEVLAALDDPATVIVDARTPGEYTDGHIPGAVNVNYPRNAEQEPPHRYLPDDDLLAMYADAGVTPDRRVIPYCSTGVRSAVTFFTLHRLGFDVSLFTGSWAEWSADPDTPKATGD